MKTNLTITVLSLFIFVSSINAQNYFPFPQDDATWQVTRCFYFYPPGWYDDHQIHMTGEDTVFNGISYKKLYFTNHHAPGSDFDTIYPIVFLGGLREVNKKIYIVSEYACIDTIARLVYDFNDAEVGDTIYSQLLSPGATDFIPHIITAIDSQLIGSEYHRRLQLTDVTHYSYEEWTEGMGSSYGLIYATHWITTDNSYDLICFSENKQNEYLNINPGFGFCQAPLPPIECDSLATGVQLTHAYQIHVFPNPVDETLTLNIPVESSVTHFVLQSIIGSTGKAGSLDGKTNLHLIHIEDLPEGLYQLFLYNDQVLLAVIKIVIGR